MQESVSNSSEAKGLVYLCRFQKFLTVHKIEFFIFAVSVIMSSVVHFSSPIDPHPPRRDSWFYAKAAENLAEVIKVLPEFSMKFLADKYTLQDYQRMGFVDPTGITTIFRVPVYVAYLSFLILVFGKAPVMFVFLNILKVGLLQVLIYQIAARCVPKKIAAFIAFLSMLYLPFYLAACRTEVELFITIMVLFTFKSFLSAIENPTWKRLLWLGFITGLTCYTKGSLLYFWLPVAVVTTFLLWQTTGNGVLRKCVPLFVGIAIPIIFTASVYTRTNGKFGLTESGQGYVLYDGQQYYTDCFYTQVNYQNKYYTIEAREAVGSLDHSSWFVTHGKVNKAAFRETFKNEFPSFLAYFMKKAFFLVSYAPNNYDAAIARLKPLQGNFIIISHFVLLGCALVSFICVNSCYRQKIFFCGLFAYLVAVYSTSNFITRYLLPLTPFYFVFCAAGVAALMKWRPSRNFWRFAGMVILFIGLILFRHPFGFKDYVTFYTLKKLLLNALFVATAAMLLLKLMKKHLTEHRVIGFLVVIFVCTVFNVLLFTEKRVLKTSVSTKNDVEQVIVLGDNYQPAKYSNMYLMVDIASSCESCEFVLNGKSLGKLLEKSPVAYAMKAGEDPAVCRWRFLNVPFEYLKTTNTITIRTSSGLKMNADYLSERINYLPSFVQYISNYPTIYGCVKAEERDRRVYMKHDLQSVSNVTRIDGKLSEKKRARVYLLAKEKGGYYLPRKYQGLSQAAPNYIALLRVIERRLVQWKETPGPDDVEISGSLIPALLGEVDTFRVGYHLY